MEVRLKFLGGAKSVTGSKYLLEIDHRKILFDCGLFQGLKALRLRNWDSLPIQPKAIDAVVLTHAHIDHSGYLPRLVKDGFGGKVYCTHATNDLMQIMLTDAGRLQEEEAAFAFRHGYSKHSKPEPLFTEEDARKVLDMTVPCPFHKKTTLFENVDITFHIAGHILGAAQIEVNIKGTSQEKKIIFSGDLGRTNDPLMFPPDLVEETDILLVEATYGNRINSDSNVEGNLADIVNSTVANQGCLIVPAFAVGRTQNLLYYLDKLIREKRIPVLPVYIDSPMAINATGLYEKNNTVHKLKVSKQGNELISFFDSPYLHFCNTPDSSKALNDLQNPSIIISASGMCTGGRILHHLYHRLSNPKDTLLFVGYQAEGTRGRDLMEGKSAIRIFGKDIEVKCRVMGLHGLSAHADQTELMDWLGHFKNAPKMSFIVHSEEEAAIALSAKIQSTLGWNYFIPEYLESFELFNGI